MLAPYNDIYCGIYDSDIIRKNQSRSEPRKVSCYELEFFHSEGGKSHINGRAYNCRRGMLLCAKPGQIRYSDFPVRCSFIRFFPTGIDRETEEIISRFPDCAYIADNAKTEYIMSLFSKLAAAIVSEDSGELQRLRINSLFYEIIYRIAAEFSGGILLSASAPLGRIARDTYEYINENYTQDCSLERIAEAVSASPNYIHTVFKQSLGITPYEFVVRKRIEKAEKLIAAGEMSMLEIALDVGFCSQSHFNKMFKMKTGQTPAQYRKNLLEQY